MSGLLAEVDTAIFGDDAAHGHAGDHDHRRERPAGFGFVDDDYHDPRTPYHANVAPPKTYMGFPAGAHEHPAGAHEHERPYHNPHYHYDDDRDRYHGEPIGEAVWETGRSTHVATRGAERVGRDIVYGTRQTAADVVSLRPAAVVGDVARGVGKTTMDVLSAAVAIPAAVLGGVDAQRQ